MSEVGKIAEEIINRLMQTAPTDARNKLLRLALRLRSLAGEDG